MASERDFSCKRTDPNTDDCANHGVLYAIILLRERWSELITAECEIIEKLRVGCWLKELFVSCKSSQLLSSSSRHFSAYKINKIIEQGKHFFF